MQTILIGIVSVLVGGGLAGAALVGIVDSQTSPAPGSPASVDNPVMDYGSSE